MKRRIALAALVFVLIGLAPAAAQFPGGNLATETTQLLNHLELAANVKNTLDHLGVALDDLEKIETPRWRDLTELMTALKEIANFGDAVSYSDLDALENFLEHFPSDLVITPEAAEAGESIDVLDRFWRGVLRDTMAGAVGAAAEQGADYDVLNEVLLELQALANGADGRDRNVHVLHMMLGAQLQELEKLNAQLASNLNVRAVEAAFDNTLRGQTLETLDAMTFYPGWNENSPSYNSYPDLDPVP